MIDPQDMESIKTTVKASIGEAAAPLVDKLNDHHTRLVVVEKDVDVLEVRAEKAETWQREHLEKKHSPLRTIRNIGIVATAIITVSVAAGIIIAFVSCAPWQN